MSEYITVAYDPASDTFSIVGDPDETYATQTLNAALAALNDERE